MLEEERELGISALDENRLPALSTINEAYPSEKKPVDLAYAHSHAVVEFLIDDLGPEKMDALLGRLRDGQ